MMTVQPCSPRQTGKQTHDAAGVCRIKSGRRFIGKHHGGSVGQRPHNGDPLTFADGQRCRILIRNAVHAQLNGQPLDSLAAFFLVGGALARQEHVLTGRQKGQQTARLEDVAHIAQSQGGQSFSVTGAPEAQNVLRGFRLGRETKDGVRRFHIRAQNARQQIQSRAFAAAARPYKGDQLPPADVKGRYGQTEALRSGALLADAAQRIHQIVMLHEKQGRELYTEAHLRAGALCPDKARAEICCAGPESGGPPPGVSRGCAGHCLRRSGKRPVPGEAPASVVTRPGACCH